MNDHNKDKGGLLEQFLKRRAAHLGSLATPAALKDWRRMPIEKIDEAFSGDKVTDDFRSAVFAYLHKTDLGISSFLTKRETEAARLTSATPTDTERVRTSTAHALALRGFWRAATYSPKEEGKLNAHIAQGRRRLGEDAVVTDQGGIYVSGEGLVHEIPETHTTVYIRRPE